MSSRICLAALVVLTISSIVADEENGTDLNVKVRDERWNCNNNPDCLTTTNKSKSKVSQCQIDEDCENGKVCHEMFRICFVKPPKPRRMRTGKAATDPTCKTDDECAVNQSCHAHFGICVDNPVSQTTTTAPRVVTPACQYNSDCEDAEYCHFFFNMCLPHIKYSLEPTRPQVSVGCTSDSQCKNGQFCHNLTRLCLQTPHFTSPSPTTKGSYSCKSHADCKLTEICHFLVGMRRRKRNRGRQKQLKYSAALGVCIARALKNVPKDPRPIISNCSRKSDCGKGRCCLRDLGLCAGYRLPGETCVAQDVSLPFSCPCLEGFTCVSKGHMMRLRRLQKRLQLPTTATERLAAFYLKTSTKFRVIVGQCQLVSG